MLLREFNYYFFSPVQFDTFSSYFKNNYDFQSIGDAKRIYNDWLMLFSRRSSVFYRSQYNYHAEITERAFCIENHLPEGGISECGLDDDYEYYASQNGLFAHAEECEEQCALAEQRKDLAMSENNIPYSQSLGDTFDEMKRIHDEIILRQRPTIKAINEFWFNSTINNPPELISQLKKLRYPDYLRTLHWQRTRAAFMLVHRGSCQAKGHYELLESWYFGWESDIDVHHLHYRNKGNERYTDLALLCKEHHKLWHANDKSGKEQIEILDDDF